MHFMCSSYSQIGKRGILCWREKEKEGWTMNISGCEKDVQYKKASIWRCANNRNSTNCHRRHIAIIFSYFCVRGSFLEFVDIGKSISLCTNGALKERQNPFVKSESKQPLEVLAHFRLISQMTSSKQNLFDFLHAQARPLGRSQQFFFARILFIGICVVHVNVKVSAKLQHSSEISRMAT